MGHSQHIGTVCTGISMDISKHEMKSGEMSPQVKARDRQRHRLSSGEGTIRVGHDDGGADTSSRSWTGGIFISVGQDKSKGGDLEWNEKGLVKEEVPAGHEA